MSNYPDGCTQADHDAYWGGPERPDPEDHEWQEFGIPWGYGTEKCMTLFCDNAQPESWPGNIQSDISGLCRGCAISRLTKDLAKKVMAIPAEGDWSRKNFTLLYLEIVALREWDGRELNEYLEAT